MYTEHDSALISKQNVLVLILLYNAVAYQFGHRNIWVSAQHIETSEQAHILPHCPRYCLRNSTGNSLQGIYTCACNLHVSNSLLTVELSASSHSKAFISSKFYVIFSCLIESERLSNRVIRITCMYAKHGRDARK